jgi:hypothetical protein
MEPVLQQQPLQSILNFFQPGTISTPEESPVQCSSLNPNWINRGLPLSPSNSPTSMRDEGPFQFDLDESAEDVTQERLQDLCSSKK